jgi:hypothetical protein
MLRYPALFCAPQYSGVKQIHVRSIIVSNEKKRTLYLWVKEFDPFNFYYLAVFVPANLALAVANEAMWCKS